MTTTAQDKAFADSLASPENWLDLAVDWIGNNLSPEDVFSLLALQDWAERNGWKED